MKHDDLYEELIRIRDLSGDLLKILDDARNKKNNFIKKTFLIEKAIKAGKLPSNIIEKYSEDISLEQDWSHSKIEHETLSFFLLEKPSFFYFDEYCQYDEELFLTGKEFFENGLLNPPFNRFCFIAENFFQTRSIGEDAPPIFGIFDDVTRQIEYLHSSKGCYVLGRPEDCVIDKMFFQLALLLAHPNFCKEENHPPEKVNKKRETSGKPHLSKYVIVSLDKKYREALSSGTGSPRRPHWRRGHMRTNKHGTLFSVRPHMVNFKGEPIERKDYKIRS